MPADRGEVGDLAEDKMRAVVCREWGGPDDLAVEEIAAPRPGPGQVRIEVHAASHSFADNLMIAGEYQYKPALPFVPGFAAAGEIVEAGPGVDPDRVGERVMAVMYEGAFAEQTVVDSVRAYTAPDGLPWPEAAIFPGSYGTAWVALTRRGELKVGETLLVLGATSAVGMATVQYGAALGARVIATLRDMTHEDLIRGMGAHEVIEADPATLRDTVRGLTDQKGADVIFDPIGGEVADIALRCVAWGGRLLIVGFAGGRIQDIPANLLLVKNVSAVGIFWNSHFEREPELLAGAYREFDKLWQAGRLKPMVRATVPMERIADAFALLKDRSAPGRVVVTMR